MKKIRDLWLGFKDAENYTRKENKEPFSEIFLHTNALDRLCEGSSFFLMGEKGTGKTAYAVFFENTHYNGHISSLKYIRETEYQKFVSLKKLKQLDLSDYTDIWKVIIYLLLSEQISHSEEVNLLNRFTKFNSVKKAVDEYYNHAFAPEIVNAVRFAEEAKIAAELVSKYAEVEGEKKVLTSFSESRYQTNLLYLQRAFEDALRTLKLKKNHILFIDGIDIRPADIPYEDYLECVKGLANAVWSINNDFFGNIKDSKGRMRVVLLIRPDIFNSLGLQNQNSKIADNSVVLDWVTTYQEYRDSNIFLLIDRLLSFGQEGEYIPGSAWDHYFPFNLFNLNRVRSLPSFNGFLRLSLYRPRDIIAMLSILKENFLQKNQNRDDVFSESDFRSPAFTRRYSTYLLGEIKDHLSFYYKANDYELFLKFFHFLRGDPKFSYREYLEIFKSFSSFLDKNGIDKPSFCESPDMFLQFLYEMNVICYAIPTVSGNFYNWCFRERNPTDIAPKIRTDAAQYSVHYGLWKALDLGRSYRWDTWNT